MNSQETERVLTIVRTFDAPREALWRAWTEPAVMGRWLHPHGFTTKLESTVVELRVGGAYRFTMVAPSGAEFLSGGTYLELREPEFLRCSWGAPDEPIAQLHVLLAAVGDDTTEMTFRLVGQADDSHRDDSVWVGWREALDELGAAIEGGRHE